MKTIVGKVMMSLLFDAQEPVLIEFLPQQSTVNVDQYADNIMQLQKNFKIRWLDILSEIPEFWHDNAWLHLANFI